MRSIAAFLIVCLFSIAAQAQIPGGGVDQYGTVTQGHTAIWQGNSLIKDGGSSPAAAIQRHDPTGATATFAQVTQYFSFYCGQNPGSCFLSNDVFNEALVAHAADLNTNTIFIAPNGNDGNSGTATAPFKTVDEATKSQTASNIWAYPGQYAISTVSGYRSTDSGGGALKVLRCLGPPRSCILLVPGTDLSAATWTNGVAATTPAAASIATCSTHSSTTVDTCTASGNTSCPTNSIIVGQKMTDVSGDIGATVTVASIVSCTSFTLSVAATGSHTGDAITFIGGFAGAWSTTVNAFVAQVLRTDMGSALKSDLPLPLPLSLPQCTSMTLLVATLDQCWYYDPSTALLTIVLRGNLSVAALSPWLQAVYTGTSTTAPTAQKFYVQDAKILIDGWDFRGVYVNAANSTTGSEVWITNSTCEYSPGNCSLNNSSLVFSQNFYCFNSAQDCMANKLGGGNQVPTTLEVDDIVDNAGDPMRCGDLTQPPCSSLYTQNGSSGDNGNTLRVNGIYRGNGGPSTTDAIVSWDMGVTSEDSVSDGAYNASVGAGFQGQGGTSAVLYLDTVKAGGNFPIYMGTGTQAHIFNSRGACTGQTSQAQCDVLWSPP